VAATDTRIFRYVTNKFAIDIQRVDIWQAGGWGPACESTDMSQNGRFAQAQNVDVTHVHSISIDGTLVNGL
jgi:hypothetical protein